MKRIWILRGLNAENEESYGRTRVWVGVNPKRPWRAGEGRQVCYVEFLRATKIKLKPGEMMCVSLGRPKVAR